MRIFNSLFLFTFCLLFSPVQAYKGRVIAVVNQQMISQSELDARVKLLKLMTKNRFPPKTLKNQVLKTLIEEALMREIGKKFEVEISDTELQQAFTILAENYQMTPKKFQTFLKKNHISETIIKKHIRSTLIWRQFISGRYHSSVQVNEKEVQERLKAPSSCPQETQLLLTDIFIPDHIPNAENTTQKIMKSLKSGESFAKISLRHCYSQDKEEKESIGWKCEKDLPQNWKTALQKVPEGGFTQPIKETHGYRILYLINKRDAQASQHTKKIMSFLQVVYPFSLLADNYEKEELYKKVKGISQNATSPAVLKSLSQKIPLANHHDIKNVQVDHLPPELQDLLESLDIFEASEPIPTPEGFVVFMVVDQKTVNTLDSSPERIRTRIREEKLMGFAKKEMQRLRKGAYIHILDKDD